MATLSLYLGASFPSVSLMPAPSTWVRKPMRVGALNQAADGTFYMHSPADKYMWLGTWEHVTTANMNTLLTEFNRRKKLALVDLLDSTSWTVLFEPQSVELAAEPGTNPVLYTIKIQFVQAL